MDELRQGLVELLARGLMQRDNLVPMNAAVEARRLLEEYDAALIGPNDYAKADSVVGEKA